MSLIFLFFFFWLQDNLPASFFGFKPFILLKNASSLCRCNCILETCSMPKLASDMPLRSFNSSLCHNWWKKKNHCKSKNVSAIPSSDTNAFLCLSAVLRVRHSPRALCSALGYRAAERVPTWVCFVAAPACSPDPLATRWSTGNCWGTIYK